MGQPLKIGSPLLGNPTSYGMAFDPAHNADERKSDSGTRHSFKPRIAHIESLPLTCGNAGQGLCC